MDLTSWVWVRDILETVINREHISHGPFHGWSWTLRVLEKSEIDNTANNDIRIIRPRINGHIIIASPHSSYNELLVLELSRSLACNASKFDVLVHLCFPSNISVYGKAKILVGTDQSELWSYIRIVLSGVWVVLLLFKLLSREFCVIFDVLESECGNGIELFVHDLSHSLHVDLAPLDLLGVVVCEGFSINVLHLTDDILRCLAVLCALGQSAILSLVPDGDESGQVTLVGRIREGVA